MLTAYFAFGLHKIHELFFAQYIQANIFQRTFSFHRIIIVECFQFLVDQFGQLNGIYFIIASYIPMVGKEIIIGHTGHSEFGNTDIQFFTGQLNSFVHVLYTQVFAYQTEKMFGAARDHDLTSFLIYKTNGITDQVAPGTGSCADQ